MSQSDTQAPSVIFPMLDAALVLAARGIPVIPLAPGMKQPAEGFVNWQARASTHPDAILSYWLQHPTAHLGCVVPAHWLVLDVDPRHNGLVGMRNFAAQHGPLPDTWLVRSGRGDGGSHRYFRLPDGTEPMPFLTNVDMGVQVLGVDHLAVLPPSLHPLTREPYTWDAAYSPFTLALPAYAPEWLLTLVHTKAKQQRRAEESRKPAKLRRKGSAHAAAPTRAACEWKDQGNTRAEADGFRKNKPPQDTLYAVGSGKHSSLFFKDLALQNGHFSVLFSLCGLPKDARVGQTIRCPFPGHEDVHPSASLLGADALHPSMSVWCHVCQRREDFVDLYKARESAGKLSIKAGVDHRGELRGRLPSRLVWTARMLEHAGVFGRVDLGAPRPSGADMPDGTCELWDLILHARAMRSVSRLLNDPMPLSIDFLEDWAGNDWPWTRAAIIAQKRWLLVHGWLKCVGKEQSGSRARLFVVTKRWLRQACVEMGDLEDEKDEGVICAAVAAKEEPPPVEAMRDKVYPPPGPAPTAETSKESVRHTQWEAWVDLEEIAHYEAQEVLYVEDSARENGGWP